MSLRIASPGPRSLFTGPGPGTQGPHLQTQRIVGKAVWPPAWPHLRRAYRPEGKQTPHRGYVDIVVFSLISRAETVVRKTTIPRMPQCYGGWRGHSTRRTPPASGRASLLGVGKHTQSLSWSGRQRRRRRRAAFLAASRVRSAIPELVPGPRPL